MKILHALPSLSGGGAERQLRYLAEEQVRAGHDVAVAYHDDGPAGAKARPEGVALHRLRARSNYDPALLWQVWRLIRTTRPDVVHTWILQMDVLAGGAALLARTPWVCREPVSGAMYGEAWKHSLRRGLVARADAIVANSAAGEAHWAERSPRGSCHTIRNALPLDAIDATEPSSRDALDVAEGRGLVLYAGRMEQQQKNVRGLLAGLERVVAETDATALVCGEGPLRAEAEERVAAAGLAERIRITGWVDDVWSVMKAADVFVSVAYFEGQPNTVMEAMACGCPLVVSDIPMHREFLDGSSALFVDPDDPRALAAAIADCLADPAAARGRAEAAKAISAAWSVAEMARAYERVYEASLALRR